MPTNTPTVQADELANIARTVVLMLSSAATRRLRAAMRDEQTERYEREDAKRKAEAKRRHRLPKRLRARFA